jgi:thymidylate synthase
MSYIYSIDITDLNEGNKALWQTIEDKGKPLTYGDATERKKAKYIYCTVSFSGPALRDLTSGIMPDAWLFRGKMVSEYVKQFDDPEAWKLHEYSYADRLLNYEAPNPDYPKSLFGIISYAIRNRRMPSTTIKINQLNHMRDQLLESFKLGIQSTRIVAITLQPHLDYGHADIPCLQEIQVFPVGGNAVEIHYVFRSHDYTNGLMANMAYLNNGIINHVLKPCGADLKKVVVTSQIAHLYDADGSVVEMGLAK